MTKAELERKIVEELDKWYAHNGIPSSQYAIGELVEEWHRIKDEGE